MAKKSSKSGKSSKRLTVAQRIEVRDSTYIPPEEKLDRCELCRFFWLGGYSHTVGIGRCQAIQKRDELLAIKVVHSLGSCDLLELREAEVGS